MKERDTFLRAIADAWDDPTPVLVFADWAEEHGTDDPPLLRWYGWHVMPALAAVPKTCPRVSVGVRDRARKAVGHHPQADQLFRAAAVAFCRRPCVWDRDGNDIFRPAVELARLFALGFVPDAARLRAYRRADAEANALTYQIETVYISGDHAQVTRLSSRMWGNLLAKDILSEVPGVTGPGLAHRTSASAGPEHAPTERGWQAAVYAALAAVRPLA
ncbi:MAG TPA: TIGR02996 domain-containing protein [Gemmataceae bacterium]|nr:TIGR02996 domain-containing protein [Gemmataceae bacterium]